MSPHQILKKYLQRKQKVNPKYSLRSLARDLKLSPSFASRLLSGKQEIPLSRLPQIAKILDMDAVALKDLKKSLASLYMTELGLQNRDLTSVSKISLAEYEEKAMTSKEMSVLSPWYNLSLLELATCQDFQASPAWMAARLGLSVAQVETSLKYLVHSGYLKQTDEGFVKTSKLVRLPTKHSVEIVRHFHKAMMELAVKEMFQHSDAASFTKRMITSTSVAVNPENLEAAKERLQEMQLELIEILRDGECTEVYDLTLALFPLTK